MKNLFTIKMLPSFITMGNLCSGFFAIAMIAEGYLNAAAWLIFAGMLCDMFDGKVARLAHVSSAFGEQLDSLSDMITFGAAPAFLLKVKLMESPAVVHPALAWCVSALFIICAASRLARFNVTTQQDEASHAYFQGLATPGAAGVVASLVLLSNVVYDVMPLAYYKWAMLAMGAILAILMVSHIRYIHMGVHFLKKNLVVVDCVTFLLFLALVIIEPQLFIIALSACFLIYAFAAPIKKFCQLLFITPEAITQETLANESVQPDA
jgi:CDP-diacylglycerol--serine O-phosphatidyltransferase